MIDVIDFDPIGIETYLVPQNDRQHLNFVKYIYVIGKKIARNDCKMAKHKSCPFHFESEFILDLFQLFFSMGIYSC